MILFFISCVKCLASVGLSPDRLWPIDIWWQQGSKHFLSFQETPTANIDAKETVLWGPFWESKDSWGITRARTMLFCKTCGTNIGMWCADGPPADGSVGQFGLGSSQYTRRLTRYKIKEKSVLAPIGQGTK